MGRMTNTTSATMDVRAIAAVQAPSSTVLRAHKVQRGLMRSLILHNLKGSQHALPVHRTPCDFLVKDIPMRWLAALLLGAATCLVATCGQKGPLTLPEEQVRHGVPAHAVHA